MSGLPPHVFLGHYFRKNLFEVFVDGWDADAARVNAQAIHEWIKATGNLRVVLLGPRVAEAFTVPLWGNARDAEERPNQFVAIPHPLKQSSVYVDARARHAARQALQWGAGFGELVQP